jgi:hypothetical protein
MSHFSPRDRPVLLDSYFGSTLPLLVAGVGRADHVDLPFTLDDLAAFTDALDAGSDFHSGTGLVAGGNRDYTQTAFAATTVAGHRVLTL